MGCVLHESQTAYHHVNVSIVKGPRLTLIVHGHTTIRVPWLHTFRFAIEESISKMPGPMLDVSPSPPNVVYWDDFQDLFAESHRQGEHVAIVGPNGSGKTMMGLELCKIIGARRQRVNGRPSPVCVLQYKPRDDTLRMVLPEESWPVIKKWPPKYGEEHCIVWPRGGPPSTAASRQRAVFAPLLDKIYVEGGQTVYIPEAAYFERAQPAGLSLSGTMEQFWSTARSNKLTVISDTQRPRKVTLLMWTEPAWVIIYQLDHRDDVKHVADLVGTDFGTTIWTYLPRLGTHECLVIRRQRHPKVREVYVTRVTGVTGNNSNGRGR